MHGHERGTIHHETGEGGTIEVVAEGGGVRTLYFGSPSKQTSVDLNDPGRLVLPYTRCLAGAVLLSGAPRRVLMLGMGGGALVHFFRQHFPAARLDVVECWDRALAVAREHFALPEEDARLAVYQGDAADFVREPPEEAGDYDLVLVDAFGPEGVSASVSDSAFFAACRKLLAPHGVVAANLWSGNQRRFNRVIRALEEGLAGELVRLPAARGGNIILMGPVDPATASGLGALRPFAQELSEETGLDYVGLLDAMRYQPGRDPRRWRLPGLG
jgi:spermidine synthase